MRKFKVFTKKRLKSIVAIAFAAVMAVPSTTMMTKITSADESVVEAAVPARLLDFNEGLKEYYKDEVLKLDVVKTEDVLVYKTAEEKETSDRTDANGLLYMGEGENAYYKRYTISNQPSTYVDDQRGTVLYMGKTIKLDAVMKTKSADIDSTVSTPTDNTKLATATLDKEIPVSDAPVQPEMIVESELGFVNPIADSKDKFTASFWVKVPEVNGVDNKFAGEWHSIVVTVDGDAAAYYLDGEAKEDADAIAGIKAWVAGSEDKKGVNRIYIGGNTTSGDGLQSALGVGFENAAIMMDDIAFYKEALTAEQVADKYAEDTAEEIPYATRIKPGDFKDILNLEATFPLFSGLKCKPKAGISVISDTVNGSKQDILKINANTKVTYGTGAYIPNPFAGKELDGATISFWTKQDPRDNKSNGKEASALFSIIDEKKPVVHEKSEVNGEAWSIIYAKSDGTATFKESYSDDGIGNKLKNLYMYSISAEDREAHYIQTDWHYITVVMNNAGVNMYVDGVLYENDKKEMDKTGVMRSIAAGTRFLDGYYQREADETDPLTKYNIFGGSNNQYATSMMSYLKSADANLYFGFVPERTSNVKTNPAYFAGIRVFDTALDASEVSKLYKNNKVFDSRPGVGGVLGDADGSGEVDLDDVLAVLKAALKVEALDADAEKRCDLNENGEMDLDDVLAILKIALKVE